MNKSHIKKLIIFVFIGLIILPLTANAWDPIGWVTSGLSGMASDVASAIGSFFFDLITLLVAGLPGFGLDLLNTAVHINDWMQISMTNSGLNPGDPGYNPLVGEGWGITRNLANIFLIFGLVVIAINIILGNQEVQAKKSLINFVLIAILINFTPVICGVIIDASNALTFYFLEGGARGDLVNFLRESVETSGKIDFVSLIVFFFFGELAFIIYLLYALLFVARHVILWILIILSPLAFASKVFPKSKYIIKFFPSFCYWDEWWDQFIQWNVIGIPAGLFIYLSNIAMVEIASGVALDSSLQARMFMYIIPFVFMVVGFFVTMSSGGAVGAKISGAGKQIWKKTGAAAVGAGVGAGVAAGKYAKGRAGALSTYTKEGTVGRASAIMHNIREKNKNEKIDWHTREGREEGRQKYREFKTGVKEKAAGYGLISHETAYQKSKEEKKAEEMVKNMDIDYFNKHQEDASMSSEVRKAGDIKFMKDDTSAYLKGAGDNQQEYQRRLKVINTYGDNSKAHKKIKTKALMDANFKNTNLAGETDWGQLYGDINLNEELKKLSAKEFREMASPEFLRNESGISNANFNQLNDIRRYGSKAQNDAINEIEELYRDDNTYDKKGKLDTEGPNTIRIKEELKEIDENIEKLKGKTPLTPEIEKLIKENKKRKEEINNLKQLFI